MNSNLSTTNEIPHPYPRYIREEINTMSSNPTEEELLAGLERKVKTRRSRPKPLGSLPFLGDLVFLPANLTRLVIDPYREACNTRVVIGKDAAKPLELSGPVVIGDITGEKLKPEEMAAVALGAAKSGVALRLRSKDPAPQNSKIIRVISFPLDEAMPDTADAIELQPELGTSLDINLLNDTVQRIKEAYNGIPVGISICAENLQTTLTQAIEIGIDFVSLYCMISQNDSDPWPDESGTPMIALLTETMELIRELNAEEDIDILYFGCIQCGGDLAKIMSLGAKAAILGKSALIAVQAAGGQNDAPEYLERYLQAIFQETAILARCCGKTDINNLEPEDLRAFTIETARATGIRLVGKDQKFRL